jgi:hypothetical protein
MNQKIINALSAIALLSAPPGVLSAIGASHDQTAAGYPRAALDVMKPPSSLYN